MNKTSENIRSKPGRMLCFVRAFPDYDIDHYHITVEIVREKKKLKFSVPMRCVGRMEDDFFMICDKIVKSSIKNHGEYRSEITGRVYFDKYQMDVLRHGASHFPYGDVHGILNAFEVK